LRLLRGISIQRGILNFFFCTEQNAGLAEGFFKKADRTGPADGVIILKPPGHINFDGKHHNINEVNIGAVNVSEVNIFA